MMNLDRKALGLFLGFLLILGIVHQLPTKGREEEGGGETTSYFSTYCGTILEKKDCICKEDLLRQDEGVEGEKGNVESVTRTTQKPSTKLKFVGISSPKCGSTWLRVLFSYVVHLLHEKPPHPFELNQGIRGSVNENETIELMFGMFPTIRERYPEGGIQWVHENTTFEKKPSELAKVKTHKRYNHLKVVFLVRDPRDVVVSLYFDEKYRLNRETHVPQTIKEFLSSEAGSFETTIEYFRIWWDQRFVPESFLLVRYEDLLEDTEGELERVLEFFGYNNIDPRILKEAVEFAKFDNMKKLEHTGLRVADPDDNRDNYKTRVELVGSYRKYFDEEDIELMDKRIRQLGLEVMGYPFPFDRLFGPAPRPYP